MTDIVNRGLLRNLRLTLYSLKRRFGGTVYIYTLLDGSTNYATGVKSSTQSFTHVRRAIVLPVKVAREVAKDISTKPFKYGGSYDTKTRLFVIDSRDLPADFEIEMDDWINYNGFRFNLKSIEKLEMDAGWLLTGTAISRLTGPMTPQMVLDNLIITQTAAQVIV